VPFDSSKPNDYLTKFALGLKGKQKLVAGKVVEK
jgi:nitrate/nitrite transport system substrate-binding protein